MKYYSPLFCFFLFIYPSFAQKITCSPWQKLIPSVNLPSEIHCQKSNNNLDLIKFQGKYFLAFRTAPTHFASKKTRLYIISSADLQSWSFEKEIYCKSDLREPRFVEFNDKLFLYYFEGGIKIFRFEPKHVMVSQFSAGSFSEPKNLGLDGYVPWRLKVHQGTLFLSAYSGVNLYNKNHSADLRLFTSTDGFVFSKLSQKPQCDWTGAEEGEFEFDDDGNLWATIRLEGDGALIAYADKSDLSDWRIVFSKYKYDSALMFKIQNEFYVISRKNLDGNGKFAQASRYVPDKFRHKYNLIKYSFTKKTTALYKLDKKNKKLVYISGLMGTGDTAYPALVDVSSSKPEFIVMNYSSNILSKEKNWIKGQLSKTFIYWTKMSIEEK